MDQIRVLAGKGPLTWDYDEEADVLYVSVGKPAKALGIDIGEGIVARYDEQKQEVIGLTILGLRSRVMDNVTRSP